MFRKHSKLSFLTTCFSWRAQAYGRQWCCEETHEHTENSVPDTEKGKHPKRSHLRILRALSHTHSRACSATRRLVLYCFGGWVEDAGITLHISPLTHVQLFFSPLSLWWHPLLRLIGATPPSLVSRAAPGQLVACLHRYLLSSVSASLLFLCLPSTREEWLAYRRREELSSASEQETSARKEERGKYDQERLESLREDNISRLVGHSRSYISGWTDLQIVSFQVLFTVHLSCL